VSVCWSQPRAVPKRMNQSSCRLGYRLAGNQGTMYYVGAWIDREKGHFWGISRLRCALLRSAGRNASCVLLAQRSSAKRMCERPLTFIMFKRGLLLPVFCGLCVCLLVTTMSCAKTDEPIELPLRVWTRMNQGTMC